MRTKLKILSGYAILEQLDIPKEKTLAPEVAHHILVVDRSGSMYYDINRLKQSIEQAIAVESYGNPDVLTTLISFSSQGDLTLHWLGIPVEEVMKLNKPYIQEIRSLKATYLTGMSQALHLALENIRPDQTTGITLFTDGYANDPSPSWENRALADFVEKARKIPGLFMNCVGYRSWCDWPRLNAMSNALCGKTVQAKSFKDVLDVMKDTQELLAHGVRPVTVVESRGAKFLMGLIGDKVVATYDDLTLTGLSEDDKPLVYGVSFVEKRPRDVLSATRQQRWLYGALAYAYLSLGDLRGAKEALFQSGNKTLYEQHKTALTPSAIADMLTDLQHWVEKQSDRGYSMGRNTRPKHSMNDLVEAINSLPAQSVSLDLDLFWKTYVRRSVKKLLGTRLKDGGILPPAAEVEGVGPCYITKAEWSTTEATLNLRTSRRLRLTDAAGKEVTDVGGIALGLREYRQYTLLGSGELIVKDLPLRIVTKEAWQKLKPFLPPIKANKTFKAGKTYIFRLKDFSLTSEEPIDLPALVARMRAVKHFWAEEKLLKAMEAPEVHVRYTPEQIEALRAFHVTPSLFFSPPTTMPYRDRSTAISQGEIDVYTRYKVLVGDSEVLHKGKLHSGNKALARYFKVTYSGGVQKKPKASGYWRDDFKVEAKPRSPRAKYNAMDDLMEEVYTDLLVRRYEKLTEEDFRDARSVVGNLVELFEEQVRPLVVELGCTGMMPADLEDHFETLDAEGLLQRFPALSLSKKEKEGTFFVHGGGKLIISVFPETADYTPALQTQQAAN